jgi:hypothetical protein
MAAALCCAATTVGGLLLSPACGSGQELEPGAYWPIAT